MGKVITPVDLGFEEMPLNKEDQKLATLKEARETAEIRAVCRALALNGNNISQAAKLLEISRPTLHDLLKKHGISTDK
jgi:two-component system NtrC family response regulator